MKLYVYDGTPDEISQVVQKLQATTPAGSKCDESEGVLLPQDPDGPKKFVETDFARRTLSRIKLSDPFKAMIRVLNKAHPEWVHISELHEAAGYKPAQFAGLMGAFGRRMAHTKGYEEDAHFFDYEWDEETEAWKYRLPETVHEAIRLEGLV